MVECFARVLREREGGGRGALSVVEFCAGTGSLGLALAERYPQHNFILVDMNEWSLRVACKRARTARLGNVLTHVGRIEEYAPGHFDVGLALHACGAATDIAIEQCIRAKASFVMAPCCVGKVNLHNEEVLASSTDKVTVAAGSTKPTTTSHAWRPVSVTFPRSKQFRAVLTAPQFRCLAKAADFGHGNFADYLPVQKRRRLCKCFVERDRVLRAEEAGYETRQLLMLPLSCTPKNDIIAGWPRHLHVKDASGSATRRWPTADTLQAAEHALYETGVRLFFDGKRAEAEEDGEVKVGRSLWWTASWAAENELFVQRI